MTAVQETNQSSIDLVLNPGSERNLISICLRNEDKIIDVENAGIFADHFGVPAHKYIYMSMMYLYEKRIKPTAMAISEVLSSEKARKAVDELGGLDYLVLLGESTVPEENLPIFIKKVQQSHTRRMLYQISEETKQFVLTDEASTLNPDELIMQHTNKVDELHAMSSSAQDEVYKMGDETDDVLAQRAETPNTVPGLETGMVQVDRYTGGGCPGDLIVVCAESKTGKSVMNTNWSTKFSVIDRIPGLYIDTEMNSRSVEDRILANLSGVPEIEIRNGMYVMDTENGKSEEKLQRIRNARDMLKAGHLYHVSMPHFTIEKVMALAKKYQKQYDIKYLVFDYIKIPSSAAGSMRNTQEYQQLGFFTSGLKELAEILKIPVYTACQANREDLGNTNKDASSIGGSYRILQLASKLMFLTNKSDEQIAKDGIQNGNQVLQIKYQRTGESDCPPINIFFNRPILRMTEV